MKRLIFLLFLASCGNNELAGPLELSEEYKGIIQSAYQYKSNKSCTNNDSFGYQFRVINAEETVDPYLYTLNLLTIKAGRLLRAYDVKGSVIDLYVGVNSETDDLIILTKMDGYFGYYLTYIPCNTIDRSINEIVALELMQTVVPYDREEAYLPSNYKSIDPEIRKLSMTLEVFDVNGSYTYSFK